MDIKARTEASTLLFSCWRKREVIASLPEAIRPRSKLEAYAVQAELMNRSSASLVGWKVAASSAAGQRHINVEAPLAGRLLSSNQRPDGGAFSLRGNRMRVAEIEFAFRMGRSLAPRAAPYGIEDVLDAVGALLPAIECPDSRYADFTRVGAAQLIADDACADQFVFGQATHAQWRSLDLAAYGVSATTRAGAVHKGSGANVLGDPRIALTWLANELSEIGVTLAAGETVMTGTCLTPIAVAPGERIQADFGRLGGISATFEE